MRRILGFRDWYPAARRVILATNYRCPPEVVAAGRRLVEHNVERFPKPIRAGRDGPSEAIAAVATGAPDWPERLTRLVRAAAEGGGRAGFLARTRSELTPLMLALTHAGVPDTTPVPSPIDAEPVVALLAALERHAGAEHPFPVLRRLRRDHGWDRASPQDALGEDDHAALDALLGWAANAPDTPSLLRGARAMHARLAELRRPDAAVELLTVHGAKGREWPLVILVGWEAERFPNRRALRDAVDPVRAMEEERRLGYVAVTRATRRLVLAFDPARPSPFLAEMGYSPSAAQHIRTASRHRSPPKPTPGRLPALQPTLWTGNEHSRHGVRAQEQQPGDQAPCDLPGAE